MSKLFEGIAVGVLVVMAVLFVMALCPAPASAKTYMWVGAHGDDVVTTMNYLGPKCASAEHECIAVIVTNGSAYAGDQEAFPAMGFDPIWLGLKDLVGSSSQGDVLDAWELKGGLNVTGEIERGKFQETLMSLYTAYNPDEIILLDPRHGTGGHATHLVTGWHGIEAANRVGMGDRVYVSSVIRHIADSYFWGTGFEIDRGEDWHGFKACVEGDRQALVIYDGWSFTEEFLSYYPSLFDSKKLLRGPKEWRVNVLLPWAGMNPMDGNYNQCMGIWR